MNNTEVESITYPEFILRTSLQALYSTGQVFSSVLWMKVCSLWEQHTLPQMHIYILHAMMLTFVYVC